VAEEQLLRIQSHSEIKRLRQPKKEIELNENHTNADITMNEKIPFHPSVMKVQEYASYLNTLSQTVLKVGFSILETYFPWVSLVVNSWSEKKSSSFHFLVEMYTFYKDKTFSWGNRGVCKSLGGSAYSLNARQVHFALLATRGTPNYARALKRNPTPISLSLSTNTRSVTMP